MRRFAFAVLPLVLVALSACPGNGEPAPLSGGAAGEGAGGAAGADAGPPWDPVWHLTQKKSWPTLDPSGMPDCGPACRIALNLPVTYPTYYGFTYTPDLVLSETPQGLAYAPIGSDTTYVVGPPFATGEAPLQACVAGGRASFLADAGVRHGNVEVMDLATGEIKAAYSYDPSITGPYSLGVALTALNSTHVFWEMDAVGLMSRNLLTGEIRTLVKGVSSCFSLCATEQGLICTEGAVLFVDQDKGGSDPLDFGGGFQTEGFCSPDRKRYVWIDYRDPPGPGSTDSQRNGGEVYMRDLDQGKTWRLTYDSPSSPIGKVMPAIGDDLAVWNEPPPGLPANPSDYQSLVDSATTLVKLDLHTGEKCRLTETPPRFAGFKSVYGHHMYGDGFDKATASKILVDVNLDDPALQWQCEPTPNWPDGGIP